MHKAMRQNKGDSTRDNTGIQVSTESLLDLFLGKEVIAPASFCGKKEQL